jgi:hypothetical protein
MDPEVKLTGKEFAAIFMQTEEAISNPALNIYRFDQFKTDTEEYLKNATGPIYTFTTPNFPNTPVQIPSQKYAGFTLKGTSQYTTIVDGDISIRNGNMLGTWKQTPRRKLDYDVFINNVIFKSKVEIQSMDGKEYKTRLIFSNCQFQGGIGISNCSFYSVLFNNNCIIQREMFVANTELQYLGYSECRSDEISLWKGNEELDSINNLEIKYSTINTVILNSNNLDKLLIQNSTCKLVDIKHQVSEIKIHNLKPDPESDDFKFNKINYTHAEHMIACVNIEFQNERTKPVVHINDININKILFKGLFKDTKVLLKNLLNISKFEFKNFTNSSRFSLQNISIREEGHLILEDSNLGKMEFHNVDLSRASEVRIVHSSLLEAVFVDTLFCYYLNGKSKDDIRGGREAYRQFKHVLNKQGSKLQEMKFQEYELNAHLDSLKWSKEEGWDKAILWLNKFSSNHGQNLKRALLTTLTVSAILYIIYCWIIGFLPGTDTKTFLYLNSYFLEYINPIHKADFIPDDINKTLKVESKNPSFARIWEALSRVIISYFIYQFVQSFRKFGKSS